MSPFFSLIKNVLNEAVNRSYLNCQGTRAAAEAAVVLLRFGVKCCFLPLSQVRILMTGRLKFYRLLL